MYEPHVSVERNDSKYSSCNCCLDTSKNTEIWQLNFCSGNNTTVHKVCSKHLIELYNDIYDKASDIINNDESEESKAFKVNRNTEENERCLCCSFGNSPPYNELYVIKVIRENGCFNTLILCKEHKDEFAIKLLEVD